MGDNGARITRIEMPDGTPVWARISGAEQLEGPARGPAFTDIGYGDIADRVQARVESLRGVVTSVARSLAEPLRAVRPDEVSVEFGIELTAKAGKVVGLLADGEAKGAITVTLTWHGGGPPLDPAPPARDDGTPGGGSGSTGDPAAGTGGTGAPDTGRTGAAPPAPGAAAGDPGAGGPGGPDGGGCS